MNNLKIITPFYNPGEFLENCVSSLISQKYDNYTIIFIDDCSTDGSFDKLPIDNDKVIVIKNEVRKTALENIHDAIINHCEPDDIVILVDGDDWLINNRTFSFINEFYEKNDCWVMYGQAVWTNGREGLAREVDKEIFINMRSNPFFVSHIRTFRAGLYQKIADQDPTFSCMKDNEEQFYKMTYDVAIMFPIMEMAGYEKVKFNNKVLYVYNRSNPISDDRVNQALQTGIHVEINKKPSFKRIESYK